MGKSRSQPPDRADPVARLTVVKGAIIAAWITFGTFRLNSTWAWRIPSIFQALPSVLQ